MRAQSQRELIRVLNEEPSKVYLQDLRHGLLAYDRDNIDTAKIAACNTNIEISAPEEKKIVPTTEDEKENKEEHNDTKEDTSLERKTIEDKTNENETSAKPATDENKLNAEDPKSESNESKDATEQPENSGKESEKEEEKK